MQNRSENLMHRYGTSFCGQMDAPSFALWQANAQHDPSGWLQRLRAHKEAPILASHHEPSAITNPLQHRAHNSLPPGQDEHGIAQTFLPKLLPRHCKRRSQWRDRAPVAESKQTAPTYRALCAESKLFELPCFTHSLTNPSSLPPGQDRALQCSNLLAKVATSAL